MCKDPVAIGRRVILKRRKDRVVGVQTAKEDNIKNQERKTEGSVWFWNGGNGPGQWHKQNIILKISLRLHLENGLEGDESGCKGNSQQASAPTMTM